MKNFIKIFWITLLTVCYQLEAKNVPGVSYIDNVVLNYNNGKISDWFSTQKTSP